MPTQPRPAPQDRTPEYPAAARLTARVRGRVQNVGFRAWTGARARALGLVGSATNAPDGSVEVVAQGPRGAAEALLVELQGGGTPGHVRDVTFWWGEVDPGLAGFAER